MIDQRHEDIAVAIAICHIPCYRPSAVGWRKTLQSKNLDDYAIAARRPDGFGWQHRGKWRKLVAIEAVHTHEVPIDKMSEYVDFAWEQELDLYLVDCWFNVTIVDWYKMAAAVDYYIDPCRFVHTGNLSR